MTFGLASLGRFRSDGLVTPPCGVSGSLRFLAGEGLGVVSEDVALLPRLLLLGVTVDCWERDYKVTKDPDINEHVSLFHVSMSFDRLQWQPN